MAVWATADHVRRRVRNAVVTASSDPSTIDVVSWLDFAEAQLRAILAANGAPVNHAADSDAGRILGEWATDYAEGRLRAAWSSGDPDSDGGQIQLDAWERHLADLRSGSVTFVDESASTSIGARRVSHGFPARHRVRMGEVID